MFFEGFSKEAVEVPEELRVRRLTGLDFAIKKAGHSAGPFLSSNYFFSFKALLIRAAASARVASPWGLKLPSA